MNLKLVLFSVWTLLFSWYLMEVIHPNDVLAIDTSIYGLRRFDDAWVIEGSFPTDPLIIGYEFRKYNPDNSYDIEEIYVVAADILVSGFIGARNTPAFLHRNHAMTLSEARSRTTTLYAMFFFDGTVVDFEGVLHFACPVSDENPCGDQFIEIRPPGGDTK